MTTFRKALLWTAIPLVGLALLSTGGVFREEIYFIWFFDAMALAVAFAVSIILAIARKEEESTGIIVGVALGLLALAVTCYANINTINVSY